MEPDISVICDKNKLTDKGCDGAPDLVVEIVSPSTARMDYAIKLFKYRAAGVREYWIINPDTRMTMTYHFATDENEETAAQIPFEGELLSAICSDFRVTLAELPDE